MIGSARRVGATLAVAGAALVVVSNLAFGSYGGSAFVPLIGLTLAALVPYAILYVVGRSVASTWGVAGAGAAALAVESGSRASVFLFPRGATAAGPASTSPSETSMRRTPSH